MGSLKANGETRLLMLIWTVGDVIDSSIDGNSIYSGDTGDLIQRNDIEFHPESQPVQKKTQENQDSTTSSNGTVSKQEQQWVHSDFWTYLTNQIDSSDAENIFIKFRFFRISHIPLLFRYDISLSRYEVPKFAHNIQRFRNETFNDIAFLSYLTNHSSYE